MAEKSTQTPPTVTKSYKIKNCDFRFRGKTYPENSIIQLSDDEYKLESKKNKLELQESPKKKEVTDGTGV